MVLALILFENTTFLEGSLGASVAGFVEEPAKLAALVILMRRKRKFSYILNGLLMGAAVGCGFASFESAGYAMRSLLDSQSMIDVIQMRGILSPFSHIVWTAIAGGALWRARRGGPFYFALLKHKEFYMPFLVVVACHCIWNADFELPFFGKYIACGLVAWIVALSLVNLGIRQIADERAGVVIFKESQT